MYSEVCFIIICCISITSALLGYDCGGTAANITLFKFWFELWHRRFKGQLRKQIRCQLLTTSGINQHQDKFFTFKMASDKSRSRAESPVFEGETYEIDDVIERDTIDIGNRMKDLIRIQEKIGEAQIG
ncbi:hypothetical protein M0802_015469 [Mischocyttarus mexicanus]|nr:hypothetical protein M0802_015469 [Mischocyttarus mexicanus]